MNPLSKDEEVMRLKPNMVLVPSPVSKEWVGSRIKFAGETTAQAKADGEFDVLYYNKHGETFTKNKYGRVETPKTVPAIADFVKVMKKQQIKKAVFLVEMHVFQNKPLRVCDFIHYLKGHDLALRHFIRLGFFRMVSVEGKNIHESASWQFEEMQSLLGKQKRLLVLPWTQVKTKESIEKVWKSFVKKMSYEGLVIRNAAGEIIKMKPELELDAVIVALNKNDGYSKKRGTSLRLALMIDKDTFVEIGDVASGITHDLRRELWKFKEEFGIVETKDKFYVEPVAVVNVMFTNFWQKDMPSWTYDGKEQVDLGNRKSITMQNPVLIQFRTDKTACVKDVGLRQIPRGRYENEDYGEEKA